eukprot:1160894-Pelagomonas_calceolata.AAC.7
MNHSLNFEAVTPHSWSGSSCCKGLTSRKEHPGASSSSDSLPHPVPALRREEGHPVHRWLQLRAVNTLRGWQGVRCTRMHHSWPAQGTSALKKASKRVNMVKMHAFVAWEHHCSTPDTHPACPSPKYKTLDS